MHTPNEETIQGYQLEGLIGEGAYGAVYRARQQAVDRQVAVKIILPEFANRPEFIRRFEAEAQLVAQLEHIQEPLPYVRETRPDLPAALDGVIQRATSWMEERRVGIWDAKTLEEINIYYLEKSWASDASWSPDGKLIATTSMAGEASIRDAETGEILLNLFPDNYTEQVEGIVWTKDGTQVVLFTLNNGYRFNAATGEELMQYFGHTSAVYSINFSPDEELMFTAGGDGNARVYDVETGVELLVYDVGGWTDADLSPDSTQLLVASTEGEAFIFPVWETAADLVDYARDCCLVYELTPQEREQFGLPPE